MSHSRPLRIGFVPEHFSTPIFFAQKHFGLSAELLPFPSGTGHMITALRSGEIDVGIGLTEGWVAGLGKEDTPGDGGYRIVGTYVETPLCWAISTGAKRPDMNSISSLKGSKIGVSRIGSGSYVMGYVLANKQGWLSSGEQPFSDFVILDNFANLRAAVNDGRADFFMWEHFTSKRYYDSGEIRRMGEIYTPWPSWQIAASTSLVGNGGDADKLDPRLLEVFAKLDQGVKYFGEHHEEAVQYISRQLDYSELDAREWLKTVEFATKTEGVDLKVLQSCMGILRQAGILVEGKGMQAEDMMCKGLGAQFPGEVPSGTNPPSLPQPMMSLARSIWRRRWPYAKNPQDVRRFFRHDRVQRTARRFESTKPKPKPEPSSIPPSSASSEAARRNRLSGILDRTLRWTPRRLRPYGERLRSAPLSHVVAFLILHEITAIVPIFGLLAFFKCTGWVPTSVVLGPWAEWAQEGLRRYGAYFGKKGWFGLKAEGGRRGQETLEGELDEEVRRKRDETADDEGCGWNLLWGKGKGTAERAGESEAVEAVEGKTSTAWQKAKKVVKLGNIESGYNTGIQVAAAYTITKVLLPVRLIISIWATPWGARLVSALWKGMRGKP
ncbi:hypothetical protein DL766_005082 [Monosporascus sp. MC13-8B]|uniref:Ca3427-like PBP 2 domain-containing protein n=1 Tax=Monosporascus cannonballus TaxID=155416 RepID=A0ABY0HL55_9PEZI|nr:hypothetical protein DL762_000882 [Monosporascus cannonballus]RYO95648.1 hypothetical protein DL763_003619 [Monosporascus cannonballus]RYP30005.1 hypothetical protein DL766_005082 [Monosporascus sp. MC13-8B]